MPNLDGDLVRVPVTYQAFSNVRYEGVRTFTYDREEWAEWSQEDRRRIVWEDWQGWLNSDIDAEIRFDLVTGD